MAFLGPFFFLVYGACNWVTSLRSDVGSCYFEWERWIPFVPVLIIPYMSLDLFFAGSTFMCRSKAELNTLAKRIIFAIVISGACFLAVPFRFGFERPATTGFLGAIFALLTSFDQPFNLLPSLHISLRSIVWGPYGRHTTGLLRGVLLVWFVLIGSSTVLVYQHHVLDVLGGEIVALLCFYLFPNQKPMDCYPWASRKSSDRLLTAKKNRKVGWLYASGSLVCGLLTYVGWPVTAILAWPAATLAILASGYWLFGPAIFRKASGRIPWSARILLGPYFLGARLSFLYLRPVTTPYDEVVSGILMGRKLNDQEATEAIQQGVKAVLDLTTEYPECERFLRLPYHNVQILDLTSPTLDQLHEGVEFMRKHRGVGKVYVHCALGRSRSVGMIAAYLVTEKMAADPKEAIDVIRKARPQVVVKENLLAVLHQYQKLLE